MKTRFLSYQKLKSIHFVSLTILLWGLSDAMVSFYLPIQVQSFVHNLTLFGILFGFSSLVGAVSDPILGYLSSKTRYVLFLLFGLLFSTLVVITAMMPFSLVLVLWLMTGWGLYYEFIEIAIFSYVSRHHDATEQSHYFGIIYLFLNVAYVFGPLAGGYLLGQGSHAVYSVSLVCLGIAVLFLPRLIFLHRRREVPLFKYQVTERYSLVRQLKNFQKVWKYAAVFLVAVFLYNVWDAFVWTLVPIQSIGGNALVAGLITSTFTLPLAVLSGYGGTIADRFGRHATFVVGLLAASFFTLLFGLQTDIVWQIITAGLSSLGFAFAYPALMGETSREGQEHVSQLGNITAIQRICVNAGFILGPIAGGYFGNVLGIQRAFTGLGVVMLTCAIVTTIALIHFKVTGRLHKTVMAEFDL